MFDWFAGGKPDHPLADPKRARELLAGLPAYDPARALDEVRDWLDSVMHTPGFRLDDRLALVKQLDEAGQPFQRKLLRDYLEGQRLQKVQENRWWSAAFGFWKQLGDAYAACLEESRRGAKSGSKSLLTLAACRGLRSAGQQLKWMQLRYGPVEKEAWSALAGFYRFATERRSEQELVDLYPGLAQNTTPERELLKVLMLWSTSLDALSPTLVEIAERLSAHFAPAFVIERGAGGAATHAFDLDSGRGPVRAAAAAGAPLRFGAGAALEQMQAMRQALERGVIPDALNLGSTYRAAAVQEALEHLAHYWAPTPPERRHARLKVQTRLAVLNGFERLLEELTGAGALDFQGIESWLIEDISAGGFGAQVPEVKPDWIRVGAMVGTRPEGVTRWGLGVVRRLRRDARNQGYVGVETLAREVTPVRLKPVERAWGPGVAADEGGYLSALWLHDGTAPGGQTTVALRAGVFAAGESLHMLRQGATYLLIPLGLRERGQDYDIVAYREVLRDEGAHHD